MTTLFESSDGIVSVIQSPKTKLNGDEAGFVKPSSYVSKKIKKDRFCCGNCIRYQPEAKQCYVVDIEDNIEALDCCNIWLSKYEKIPETGKAAPLLPNQQSMMKIYISERGLSSEDMAAVVNGTARAVVDQKMLVDSMRRLEDAINEQIDNEDSEPIMKKKNPTKKSKKSKSVSTDKSKYDKKQQQQKKKSCIII